MTPRTASELLTLSVLISLGADPRFQPADAAAADRNGVVIAGGHLHQFAVAVSPMSDHSVDVDDVAAMDANKLAFVERDSTSPIANGQNNLRVPLNT